MSLAFAWPAQNAPLGAFKSSLANLTHQLSPLISEVSIQTGKRKNETAAQVWPGLLWHAQSWPAHVNGAASGVHVDCAQACEMSSICASCVVAAAKKPFRYAPIACFLPACVVLLLSAFV